VDAQLAQRRMLSATAMHSNDTATLTEKTRAVQHMHCGVVVTADERYPIPKFDVDFFDE
jgi:hypothetical protein